MDFGAFISAIINFLIVAWVVFMIVKAFNKMKDGTAKLPFLKNAKGEEVIEHAPTCPFCLEEVNVGATRCNHCTAELPAPAAVTVEVVAK
ncbi:MscL family protein [Adlercreutzia muris]|uniref:MscL family protein n=1 Tax=Adlercreutzia muris TaxID=1796610 RepID=UPI0013654DCE|nr:MscL family protein [Enterorhabdus sp.]MCI9673825.1 MscL family protein [Enterorhabdus sp.]NCA33211.1 MscL family protein [Adlercreutzia muris]